MDLLFTFPNITSETFEPFTPLRVKDLFPLQKELSQSTNTNLEEEDERTKTTERGSSFDSTFTEILESLEQMPKKQNQQHLSQKSYQQYNYFDTEKSMSQEEEVLPQTMQELIEFMNIESQQQHQEYSSQEATPSQYINLSEFEQQNHNLILQNQSNCQFDNLNSNNLLNQQLNNSVQIPSCNYKKNNNNSKVNTNDLQTEIIGNAISFLVNYYNNTFLCQVNTGKKRIAVKGKKKILKCQCKRCQEMNIITEHKFSKLKNWRTFGQLVESQPRIKALVKEYFQQEGYQYIQNENDQITLQINEILSY